MVGTEIATIAAGLFVSPRLILCQEALMKKLEWTRDILSTWPSYEYVKQKESAGWRLAAVEWQRETEADGAAEAPEGSRFGEEIPLRHPHRRRLPPPWRKTPPRWKS